MSLRQIDRVEVTSSVSSVELVGITSQYAHYYTAHNVLLSGAAHIHAQITVSGSPISTSDYNTAALGVRSDTTDSNLSTVNAAHWQYVLGWSQALGIRPGSGDGWLFDFANANNEKHIIWNFQQPYTDAGHLGAWGGGSMSAASTTADGISFFPSSGTIESGIFTLYELAEE